MKESSEYFPDKLIYMTEGTGTKPENMTRFLKLTSMITRSLYSNANAYLVWNYVLRPEGGPYDAPLEKYPDVAAGAATNSPFVYYNEQTKEVQYGNDYYALAHFSKYMHVGAVRVESTDTGADSEYKLCNVVVVNPNGTMTAVIVNSHKEDVTCKMVMGEQVMEVNAPAKSTITITWEAEIN
jgi:glucosylceramidase